MFYMYSQLNVHNKIYEVLAISFHVLYMRKQAWHESVI